MFHSLHRGLARIGRLPRLLAAATCLLLAAGNALAATRSSPVRPHATGVAVVVATRDLPAGHRLAAADLAVARWPPEIRPGGARADPRVLLGQRLAAPVGRREPVTAGRVLGNGLVAGLGAGFVATSIAVDEDTASFVSAGDTVDVVAAPREDLGATDSRPVTERRARVVVSRCVVLAVVPRNGATAGWISDESGSVSVVVGVARDIALRIAEMRASSTFSVVGESP